MYEKLIDHPECVAWVLAMLTSVDANMDEDELERLDDMHAFDRIGVSRQRFLELVNICRGEIGEDLANRSWLGLEALQRINSILDPVRDPQLRHLVCRLAVGAMTADGPVNEAECLLLDYVFARWHVQCDNLTLGAVQDPPN